ncbi:MAG TPA: tRNA (adenosine(37)-N6)-threonylcarbamoyltransferase complex transferase subunit TsaD, partial [Chryseosolibacter sp.]|nr:tRNA (adenosine(37)-N6)-threonylcarbamoyltransferase complex transferase subunit TsaD [Chryseosolibacter sp.]
FPDSNMPGLDFSFSGVKTAFLYFLRDEVKKNPAFVEENRGDICASLQRHLVNMLMNRLVQATVQTGVKSVAVAGGVSANSELRKQMQSIGQARGWKVFIPAFQYCTDNAAMIAMAAHYKYLAGQFSTLDVTPLARMPV